MDGWMDVWKRRAGGEKIRGVEGVEGAPRRLGSRSAARKGGGGGGERRDGHLHCGSVDMGHRKITRL